MQNEICPLCESGSLAASEYSDRFAHRGSRVQVDKLQCFKCGSCGEILIDGEQARANQLLISAAKRNATEAACPPGALRPQEIKAIRTQLGFSQAVAARVFGGGRNAFSKYERGEIRPDTSMELLLRVAAEVPGAVAYIQSLVSEHVPSWTPASEAYHAANSTPFIAVEADGARTATWDWQTESGYLFQRAS